MEKQVRLSLEQPVHKQLKKRIKIMGKKSYHEEKLNIFWVDINPIFHNLVLEYHKFKQCDVHVVYQQTLK